MTSSCVIFFFAQECYGGRYRLVWWGDRSLWAAAIIIHIYHGLHNALHLLNTIVTMRLYQTSQRLCVIQEMNIFFSFYFGNSKTSHFHCKYFCFTGKSFNQSNVIVSHAADGYFNNIFSNFSQIALSQHGACACSQCLSNQKF